MEGLYPPHPETGNAVQHVADALSTSVKVWRGIEGLGPDEWSQYTVESLTLNISLSGLEALASLFAARGAADLAGATRELLQQVGAQVDAIRNQ